MFTIRYEQPADVHPIFEVHRAAFPTNAEALLVDALRNAGRLTISLVGSAQDQIVGHIAFSPLSVPNSLGLAPLAVSPDWQRRGLGGKLVQTGVEMCRANGIGFVVVLGSPEYYGRFGFRPAFQYGLQDEYGGGDAFQLVELSQHAVPIGHGLIQYAPEFAKFV